MRRIRKISEIRFTKSLKSNGNRKSSYYKRALKAKYGYIINLRFLHPKTFPLLILD